MRLPLILLFSLTMLAIALVSNPAAADLLEKDLTLDFQQDFFKKKKSDTAIKPFLFPKSMRVLQSCSNDATYCLFHNPPIALPACEGWHDCIIPRSSSAHPRYFEDMVGVSPEQANKIFRDKVWVKRTLLKIDPARIAPVFLGENWQQLFNGTLFYEGDKYWLYESANNKVGVDLILFYKITFNHAVPDANILTQGRIYLVHQKKILVIPDNRQSVPFKHATIEYDGKEYKEKINVSPDVLANMKNLMKEAHIKGLRRLAYDARKVIMSHK